MHRLIRPFILLTALVAVSSPLAAKPRAAKASPQAAAQALDLAKRLIAIRSVAGPGNHTAEVLEVVRRHLISAGWPAGAVAITPHGDTAYLYATWQGSDPALKPLVLAGHMDVVEAKPSDWQRDPFTPVVENGFLYGRGASDMKLDNALGLTALIELKRQGFKPRRTIVVAYSGDEETAMSTSQIIAKRLTDAELVLNPDFDLNGLLDSATGKPLYYTWQGAEKGYADFELSVTNPGGHSSEPRPDNAITEMARALARIGDYHFPAESNSLSKAFFTARARLETDPALASAMTAFAANPGDAQAVAALRADHDSNPHIATTCVVTQINGGHAINALPQKVTANVNCRMFPGRTRAETLETLRRVAAEPTVQLRDVTEGAVESSPSPLRADFTAAVARGMATIHPGLPIVPSTAKGASDCMWYRAEGVDCYIVSALFMRGEDYRSHGLDERAPIAAIGPALTFYMSLISDLAR